MKLKITQSRIDDMVTVGELIDMNDNNLKVIVGVMSRFVVNDEDEYLPEADGLKSIRALSIKELKETAANFSKLMVDTAVPPTSGEDSNAQ